MNIKKGIKKMLCILLCLLIFSNSHTSVAKPDITVDIRQPNTSKNWNHKKCCYPLTLYERASNLIEDKVLVNQDIMRIQDMLHKYWQKHTHKKK